MPELTNKIKLGFILLALFKAYLEKVGEHGSIIPGAQKKT